MGRDLTGIAAKNGFWNTAASKMGWWGRIEISRTIDGHAVGCGESRCRRWAIRGTERADAAGHNDQTICRDGWRDDEHCIRAGHAARDVGRDYAESFV